MKRLLLVLFGLTAWRAWVVLHVHAGLQVDEAQYWFWSEHLDWGYFSKPPGIAALIRASTALFGDGLLGVKALAMLCYPLTALVLYRWLRDVGVAAREARLGALLFIATPAAGLLGLAVTTDAPLLLCWSLAAWSLWRAGRDGRWRDWCLLGLWIGLGAMSKYTMGAFAVSALGFLWTVPPGRPGAVSRWRGVPVAAALALACVAPNLAWNAAHGWPTLMHTAEITVGAEASDTWSTLGEYLGGLVLLLGPLVTLWALVHAARRPVVVAGARAAWVLAAWLAAPLTLIGLAQSLHAKAQVNWTAPVLIGLVLGLVLWLRERPLRGLQGVLVAQVLLVGAVTQAGDIAHLLDVPLKRNLDVWARMRGWAPAFDRLRPALAAHGQRLQALDPTLPLEVIGGNRTVISHGAYAWRDQGLLWRAWREPDQRPQDHYQLTVPLEPGRMPRPVLYVGEAPPGESLRAALREPPQRLAVVDLEQTAGRWIHLELWAGVLAGRTALATQGAMR